MNTRTYFGNKTFKANNSKSTKRRHSNDIETMKSIRIRVKIEKSKKAA